MSDFLLWFTEGLWHIADIKAYDHILFLLSLFAGFALHDWKKILWLVTAFTLGHSITLALSIMDMVKLKTDWVEFLIPCTIMITAAFNLTQRKQALWKNFIIVVFFGFIHGLGFSALLKSLLGREANIAFPLLFFNLGLEAGQILIIGTIAAFTFILTGLLGVSHRKWRFFISSATFGVAFIMAIERIPF